MPTIKPNVVINIGIIIAEKFTLLIRFEIKINLFKIKKFKKNKIVSVTDFKIFIFKLIFFNVLIGIAPPPLIVTLVVFSDSSQLLLLLNFLILKYYFYVQIQEFYMIYHLFDQVLD